MSNTHPLKNKVTTKQYKDMARPIKNKCDYFSHDAGMRNHIKIRALRTKFGMEGYALWCMMLEHLTSCDFGSFKSSLLDLELLAGDFGVPPEKLSAFLSYCVNIGLLQCDGELPDCTIISDSLLQRLNPVFEKRGRFLQQKLFDSEVSVTETTQIKLNKTKSNKTKENQTIDNPFVDSVEFTDAWQEWEEYRRQRKTKLTPMSVKHQMKFLSNYSVQDAILIIRQSIQNGWTGLFELKNKNNGKSTLKNSAEIIGKYYE